MDSVEYVFSRICRACKCEDADMTSLFASSENPEENPRIDEMLMACAAVEASLGDGLPDLICLKCIEQLQIAYTFKVQVEKTDASLREFAKINKDDVKPVIKSSIEETSSLGVNESTPDSPQPEDQEESEKMDDDMPPSISDDSYGTETNKIVVSDSVGAYDFIQLLDNNQMLLTCSECTKMFTTLEGLKCHKRIHSGALFKCKFCEKEYTRKNHLERHEATHGKRKVHVCRICNKTLTRFEHLKRHLATHLREKPFTCKTCSRGFSRLEHLNNHVVRCKGDRVHICDVCNKAFSREDSLEVHKKLHTVEKPVLPTLENLDNIEQHYYEIDYDQNMELSDSDNEEIAEPCELVAANDNQVEDNDQSVVGKTEDANSSSEQALAESSTEDALVADEMDVVDMDEVDDRVEFNDHDGDDDVILDKRKIQDVEIAGETDPAPQPKVEIPDDYVDNYLPEVNDDDSDSVHSEYVPTKFIIEQPKVKRGRGRPRKHPPKVPGRKRGRPPKKQTEGKEKPTKETVVKNEPLDIIRLLKEEVEGLAAENVKQEKYVCPADGCDLIFESEKKLDKHAVQHEGVKLHLCEICNKPFAKANHLKRHMKSHSTDKPFICDICKKSFNRKDHLSQHQKLHQRSQEHTCEVCQKSFYKLDQLAKHQASKHGIGERLIGIKKFDCDICSKSFTTEKYRDIHVRGHLGEKQHECKTCSKVFLSKSHLTEHMKFHNENSKKFLCSECGQRFIRNDYLVIHMRRHRGEKPFKCKFCGKGFPRTTDLTVHERYHTGEKTHLCTICGRGFGRAYNLTVHMRTHTGEKPYQCTYCDAAFAQGNDLKAHVRRHTGERFHCELCPESFLMGYLLTQHKRTVHGLNVVSNIRRLHPVHKKEEDPSDPPITIPLPKPVVSDPLISLQAQLAVAQLQHHMVVD